MALLILPKAAKEAKGMPQLDWDRLKERLERIARDPGGNHQDVTPLSGTDGYRVRQGDWRAIYEITPQGDVNVVKVGHRREVYRR
jgi:mRNA-degrading endonuclease RelE of RelBE toxin-antitoxin system